MTWIREQFQPDLVSVIVPTFNRGGVICETLASVYRQNYRPLELVIVDDGSMDNTKTTVEEWINSIPDRGVEFSVKYISQPNAGGCAARNKGLKASEGEFIQYLDSDDILAPDKIGTQVDMIRKVPEMSLAFGDWRYFIQWRSEIRIAQIQRTFHADDALHEWISANNFIPSHCLLWRRCDVSKVGPWDESLMADQDGDIMLRFLLMGGQLKYCANSWAYYRDHMNNSSVRKSFSTVSADARLKVLQKVIDALESRGALQEYSDAISRRYAFFAIRWTPFSHRYSRLAVHLSKKYNPEGTLPSLINHPWLTSVLGPYLKHKIASTFKRSNKKTGFPLTGYTTVCHINDIGILDS